MNNIKKTIAFLEENFNQSEYFQNEPENKKYRLEHTYRVANIGKIIASKENLNIDALVVGCLLHDISYIESFNSPEEWHNHGRRAAQLAKPFIETLDFDEKTKQDILYGIAIHVDDVSDFEGEKTPFTLSIGDADNIDRFDVHRFYEMLKYNHYESLPYDEQLTFLTDQLKRFNRFLEQTFATPTATTLFHEKIKFSIAFLRRLLEQLENSKHVVGYE